MVAPAAAIVVTPTYWTWPIAEGQSASARPTTAAYDHPTPLDSESTLPPLLEDLAAQRTPGFRVLILVGLAHPDLGGAASERVSALIDPFRARLDIRLCDAPAVKSLLELIHPTHHQADLIHLGSYAGIRNLQLLIPHALGAEAVIALDDDERVQPDHVERALAHMGETAGDSRVLGIAGPYLQPNGSVLLKEPPKTGNAFRDKAHYINDAMRALTRGGDGLVPSPMALGGNMVFHLDLFRKVCFDPGITRGEDIDYLINARLQRIQWWFDPQLTILHVPPRHYEIPAYQRTREDVYRFIYEREKLRLHGEQEAVRLEPYPGALLRADVEAQGLAALQATSTPELVERLGAPEQILKEAREHATTAATQFPAYVDAWGKLMSAIEADPALRQSASGAFPRI